MPRDVYFSEDQRWPSKSQRFGWVVALGVVLFIVLELNLHHFAPIAAAAVILVLVLILLTVLTVQQRLSVRIGSAHDAVPGQAVIRRFWKRAARAAPVVTAPASDEPTPSIRIIHASKSPVSALSPGRRGSRLGTRERRVPLSDVENWSVDRLPLLPWLRRGGISLYPVGSHRDAVTIVLSSGERLTLPTRLQVDFLEALSAAKVDTVKQERAAMARREEI